MVRGAHNGYTGYVIILLTTLEGLIFAYLGTPYVLGGFFFFQAEDGIRAATVTGVQTCALPISDRVQADQQRRLQQSFGWDGRTAELGVHGIKHRRQVSQRFIRQIFDCPQWMVERDARVYVNECQHARLRLLSSAHHHHLSPRWLNTIWTTTSTGRAGDPQNEPFSKPC